MDLHVGVTANNELLTPELVAQVPPPGMAGPSQVVFSADGNRIAYLSTVQKRTFGKNHQHKQSSNASSAASPTRSSVYQPLTQSASTLRPPPPPEQQQTPNHTNQNGQSNNNNNTTRKCKTHTTERTLMCLNLETGVTEPLLPWATHRGAQDSSVMSLQERLRRERQRASSQSLTQFSWTFPQQQQQRNGQSSSQRNNTEDVRILVPARGSLYLSNGWNDPTGQCIHDKQVTGLAAMDALLSPDGSMVAWSAEGEVYVQSIQRDSESNQDTVAVPLTSGACHTEALSISHGVADFVAQEEMDRYRGFWWHPSSRWILVCRTDETEVPIVRILHPNSAGNHHAAAMAAASAEGSSSQFDSHTTVPLHASSASSSAYEDHRYPFAGKMNPVVRLGWISVDPSHLQAPSEPPLWLDPPREASEYLARIYFANDTTAIAQWQNRSQKTTVLQRLVPGSHRPRTLLVQRSDVWINLHEMFHVVSTPIHPKQVSSTPEQKHTMPDPLPEGSFSFLFASEATGFFHLHLYTYCPGYNSEMAVELKTITAGNWMVENIQGVDQENDKVYFTGTYDSCLERHLYVTPLLGAASIRRLTNESGMHTIVMDDTCRRYVDTSSDLGRPTTVKLYEVQQQQPAPSRLVTTLYDAAAQEERALLSCCLPSPELLHFPTTDGTETLHAALYKPDPRVHGPGPYPLVCAVYGGPHVQRVNRSWSQCADLRAQRLRKAGVCVLKCDNRGSSRRGLAFESAISKRLGRLEVLDQVAAVRQLILRGIVDPSRVGVYGWSYGGYLAAMCLCRAPDVFHVAVAGAPVTSWDGYDTHYTERYMGLPSDNPSGYRESAVFDHVPNMRGKLMIVHGLIDENVHFRHTSRLINKLIAAGKEYDLLIFPEERHSPRRLRDRIYMEQRISEYFLKHLKGNTTALDLVTASMSSPANLRPMAGHL